MLSEFATATVLVFGGSGVVVTGYFYARAIMRYRDARTTRYGTFDFKTSNGHPIRALLASQQIASLFVKDPDPIVEARRVILLNCMVYVALSLVVALASMFIAAVLSS